MTESRPAAAGPYGGKDPRVVMGAARTYLDDVRAGHVSFTDEGAPFLTMASHLQELLDLLDSMFIVDPEPADEQLRLRAQLRQAVPVPYRGSELAEAVIEVLAALPDSTAVNVTRWLEAARDGGPS